MKKPEKEKQELTPGKEPETEQPKAEPEKQPEPEKDPEPAPAELEKQEEDVPEPEEPKPEPEESKPEPASEPGKPGEVEQLRKDLLAARSQLAAYAAGVAPEMIQDAVTLATAEAQAAGEVTEEAVSKAMADVLKRHPEWKTDNGKKKGGFKLGADPDAPGRAKPAKSEDNGNKKLWNRFK